MSLSAVLGILGAWLVLAAACSLLIGRMLMRGTLAEAHEAAETAAAIETPAKRASPRRIAA